MFFLPDTIRLESTLSLSGALQRSEAETKSLLRQQYLQNCNLDVPENRSDQEPHNMLCSCIAEMMEISLSAQEMQALFLDYTSARTERERVISLAYLPCMQIPVTEIEYRNCTGNADIRRDMPNYRKACHCYASAMGEYATRRGIGVHRHNLEQRMMQVEPRPLMVSIMSSGAYDAHSRSSLKECRLKARQND